MPEITINSDRNIGSSSSIEEIEIYSEFMQCKNQHRTSPTPLHTPQNNNNNGNFCYSNLYIKDTNNSYLQIPPHVQQQEDEIRRQQNQYYHYEQNVNLSHNLFCASSLTSSASSSSSSLLSSSSSSLISREQVRIRSCSSQSRSCSPDRHNNNNNIINNYNNNNISLTPYSEVTSIVSSIGNTINNTECNTPSEGGEEHPFNPGALFCNNISDSNVTPNFSTNSTPVNDTCNLTPFLSENNNNKLNLNQKIEDINTNQKFQDLKIIVYKNNNSIDNCEGLSQDINEIEHEQNNPFKSDKIIFLDVDGVLLNRDEQDLIRQGHSIQFSNKMKELMKLIFDKTNCDIVVSSTWQFYKQHYLELIKFLVECGWDNNKIHTLNKLLPNLSRSDYEKAPYCQSRSRGIMEVIINYDKYIESWVAIDDLPLASSHRVCVPQFNDIHIQVQEITLNYYSLLSTFNKESKNTDLYNYIYSCVYKALTIPNNALFSEQGLRFGFDLSEEMLYSQTLAIVSTVGINVLPNIQSAILNNIMLILSKYCDLRKETQGLPSIIDHLIQTNTISGLTDNDVNKITEILLKETTLNKSDISIIDNTDEGCTPVIDDHDGTCTLYLSNNIESCNISSTSLNINNNDVNSIDISSSVCNTTTINTPSNKTTSCGTPTTLKPVYTPRTNKNNLIISLGFSSIEEIEKLRHSKEYSTVKEEEEEGKEIDEFNNNNNDNSYCNNNNNNISNNEKKKKRKRKNKNKNKLPVNIEDKKSNSIVNIGIDIIKSAQNKNLSIHVDHRRQR